MTDLGDVARLLARDHGLCVVTTARPDGTVQASVVNAGVMAHPRTGADVLAFVAQGAARKVVHLRAGAPVTAVARAGWEWAAVEGRGELVGPDDPAPDVDAEGLRRLLRAVFVAAGGTHDDWDEYDAVMARDRRVVVFVAPARVYSNR